jgi:hypothetical protein
LYLDGQLVKEGEEWDIEEEAGADITPLEENSIPRSEAQPVPHYAQHAHAASSTSRQL